jgi:lambda family phage portal protein
VKLNFIERFKLAMVALLNPGSLAQNRYEAGQIYSPRRSHLPGWVQDARFDANQMTRLEILRKARYFERNSALVNRLADLFEQYTVGPCGLRFVPASSDQEWNKRATEWWEGWAPYCDIASLHNWGTVQSLVARSWAIDGEVFILKTYGKPRQDRQSYPRIQLVETHRVYTPGAEHSNQRVVDGVQLDERNRPTGYWVDRGDGMEENFALVPASEVVHVGEPSRPGMVRYLPLLYAVLNDLHDLDDLQILEMDAAKDHAQNTAIIKTKSGELSAEDFRRQRFLGTGTQGTSGGSSQERSQYYQDVFQGRVKVLRQGDDYAQHGSNRPSAATDSYWDRLESKVCAGFGISKLLVYPWSMQGTVTRADLDVAATFFRSRSAVLAYKFTDIYTWAMDWATRNELSLADPPADWKKVTVRSPRSVNVDVGRNAAALIAEYVAGWRTLEEICAELGYDYRDVLRQRAIERKLARELESEFDLAPGELISAALEAIKQQQAQEPQAA